MKLLKDSQESCNSSDDVLDDDVILVWMDGDHRVITGADILGRLLRGIGERPNRSPPSAVEPAPTESSNH